MAPTPAPKSRLTLRPDQVLVIQQALTEKNVGTCPSCKSGRLTMVPALTVVPLFELHEAIAGVQESRLLACPIVCNNCGLIEIHSLGALGLMDILDRPDPGDVAFASGASDG